MTFPLITNDILRAAQNLKQFNMVKTDISELPDNLFEGTDITYFKILESQLETLNSKVFKNSNLSKIRIEKSKVSKLEADAFIHTPELETLDLKDKCLKGLGIWIIKIIISLNIFSSKRQQYRSRRFGSFKTLDRIEKVTFG